MSLQTSLLQQLAVVIPIVLLWSLSFRVHAQAIAKCWVFSPVVDEGSVTADVSTVSSVEPGSNRQLWSVSSRVTWDRPPSLDSHGAYAVSVVRMPSFKTPKLCRMEEHEVLVQTEEHMFTGLDFGFLYEFMVFVVNGTTMAKSLVPVSKGFGTPDCFQATADREFCETAVVQYAGAPIEPRLDSQCRQGTTSFLSAHLSWDRPIQVNGYISAYKLQYTGPDAPPGTLPNIVTAMPDSTSAGGRVTAELNDMKPGLSYSVLISAFVINPADDSFNEGLQVELTFRTARNAANLAVCPTPAPTTPPPPTAPPIITNPPPKRTPNNLQPAQNPTTAVTSGATTKTPTPQNPKTPSSGDVPDPGTQPPHEHTHGRTHPPPTTETTTEAGVNGKPVAPSKRAGIAIAACLVSLGIICAIAMFVVHVVRGRMADKARPDTKGAQKGTKTTTSPA